jgi:hypothetical protein
MIEVGCAQGLGDHFQYELELAPDSEPTRAVG